MSYNVIPIHECLKKTESEQTMSYYVELARLNSMSQNTHNSSQSTPTITLFQPFCKMILCVSRHSIPIFIQTDRWTSQKGRPWGIYPTTHCFLLLPWSIPLHFPALHRSGSVTFSLVWRTEVGGSADIAKKKRVCMKGNSDSTASNYPLSWVSRVSFF